MLVMPQPLAALAVAGGAVLMHRYIDQRFPLPQRQHRQMHVFALARLQMRQLEFVTCHQAAVGLDADLQRDVRQRAEPIAVFHPQHVTRALFRRHLHRAQHLLVFPQAGAGALVRIDQAVHAEVVVVRVIAVIAAVLVALAPLFVVAQQPVIAPLPDVVPLQTGVTVEHRLVFEQPPGAIAHRVGVFAQDARFGVRVFAEGVHHRHAGIHGADHVGHFGVAIFFIVDQTGRIERLAAPGHGANIAAVAGLVAQRPDDDRRVVFLRRHVAFDALDVGLLPTRIVGDAAQIADVGEAVAFQISLRHHEQAIEIAQLVKARIVGVMGGAHRVDVVLLHQHDVALHPRHIDGAPFAVIVIVAVDAVQLEVASVDVHQPVAHRDLAETHPLRHHAQQVAGAVIQAEQQLIQIGIFRIPLLRAADRQFETAAQRLLDAQIVAPLLRHAAIAVEQLRLQAAALGGLHTEMAQLGIDRQLRVAIALIKGGDQRQVVKVSGALADQIDVAEDAGHPPHVLIFDVGGIGPLHHPHR